ncbi:MAG: hypothetical protein ABIG44_02950 [Planctomycetota bacterium]
MTVTDNEHSNVEELRIGLIADIEGVRCLAAAIDQPGLRLVAQSGMRLEDGVPNVEWFDDARVLIAQSGVVGLILATATRAAVELAQIAVNHGVAVWRPPPLARSFTEAAEVAMHIRQHETLHVVASWWESIAPNVYALIDPGTKFKPIFSSLRVSAAGPTVQSWRASRVDAAGGVLACDAYNLLEALIQARKLPELVSAGICVVQRREGQPPRETENVAGAVLHYEGGGLAMIQATWDQPPYCQILEHQAADLALVLEPERVLTRAPSGVVRGEEPLSAETYLSQELQRFAAMIGEPDAAIRIDQTIERHMAVSALLQAIYLSARTGLPESPQKLYEVQGWPEPHW